ncbi:MAG: substrate-binding domain-containing protein [Myxococcota bacterium]
MSSSDATTRGPMLPWIGVAVVVAALVGTAWSVVANVGQGPRPPFLEGSAAVELPPARTDARLHIAGSGSCVPLARMLSGAIIQRGELAPEVHASIGSGGGIRALRDGAIDIALVSRSLSAAEEAQGLLYTPFAEVAVVVAAHLDVPDRAVTSEQLERLFAGEQATWSDGSPVVVLLRERGDSSHRVLEEALPGFAARSEAIRAEEAFRVLFHDGSMQVALANTPGAIGLHGNGVEPSLAGFRALSVDGVEPTAANVESDRYPFVKELGFVTMGEPTGDARTFIDFVTSPSGRALLRVRGAVPVREEAYD